MLSDTSRPPQPGPPYSNGMIPIIVPPLPRANPHARNLPWHTAFGWLQSGWMDFWTKPIASFLYGFGVFAVSILVVWALFLFRYEYALFPALAGFVVIGPLIANGLYEKSRRIETGKPIGIATMVFIRPRSGYQALFMGVMMLGLFMLWLRSAVLIYALFFGIVPFPGTSELLPMLFLTPTGWALLATGSVIGALFAGFAFAISVFAVPMLLEEKTDALSAMGISMTMVWNNLPVMLVWGAIVVALFVFSIATGFFGLVITFPVLGHASWHAYSCMRPSDRQNGESERMFIPPV